MKADLLAVVVFAISSAAAVAFSIKGWPLAASAATFYAALFFAAFLKELR